MACLVLGAALLRLRQSLLGLSQTTAESQRRALGQVMNEVEQIRYTQAFQTRFGQLDQCLGPITHQIAHADAQGLEARLDQGVPGILGPMVGHFFDHQVTTSEIHEHQQHTFQKGFVHRADDGSGLAMGNPIMFPIRGRLQERLL